MFSLNLIKKIAIEVRDIFNLIIAKFLSFSKKDLSIIFMSSERERYFRYYSRGISRNSLYVNKINKLTIYLALLLFDKRITRWVFSDLDLKAYNLIVKLGLSDFEIMCWNGSAEILEMREMFPQNKLLTLFFTGNGFKIFPKYRFDLNTSFDPQKIVKRIFFAGQMKDAEFYLKGCKDLNLAREMVYSAPILLNMVDIFEYVNLKNPNLNEFDCDYVRMALASRMRKKYIDQVCKFFGDRVTLCGPDFSNYEILGGHYINYLDRKDLQEMYKTSAISLDFGSQCGVEALYPRSLEIVAFNAASLVQVSSAQSKEIFGEFESQHVFQNIDQLISCIENLLSKPVSELIERDRQLKNNINKILT